MAITTPERARAIMGSNVFGIGHVANAIGIDVKPGWTPEVRIVPFSEKTLEECKETHTLIAVPPLSIRDFFTAVRVRHLANSFPVFDDPESQAFVAPESHRETFVRETANSANWYLVRNALAPNSSSRSWSEQLDLLFEQDQPASARVMVCTILSHFLISGRWLVKQGWGRCSDTDLEGQPVFVGVSTDGRTGDVRGLRLACCEWHAEVRSQSFGLWTMRKTD